MGRLVAIIRRTGLRKGVLGGDRRWVSIWVIVTGAQLVRKLAAPKPVVECFELKPGETIVVTDLGRPPEP